jgi:FHS family L-fucose permease-like MFS transporter
MGQRHFVWGVIAQFFYVGAQVGAGAFFINYLTEQHAGLSSMNASRLLTLALALFMAGRISGTILMSWIAPRSLLTVYAVINVALSAMVAMAIPGVSMVALIALFFFMSIMFPTIFALAVRNLGTRTKRASSYLIMSIVGGAIAPYLMGWLGDRHGMPVAYLLPAGCFAIVALYGWKFALPAR